MTTLEELQRRFTENPFFVLEVGPDATAAEIHRQGQRWLGMLALGLSAAERYDTPLGPQPRTPELVREAMAALADPDRRVVHELWARSGRDGKEQVAVDPGVVSEPPPFDALTGLGWRGEP